MRSVPFAFHRPLLLLLFTLFVLPNLKGQRDLASDTGQGEKVPLFELGPGLENYSDRASIPGGNYLYLNSFVNLSKHVSLSFKYSSDLTPNTFDTKVTAGGVRFTSPNTQVDTRLRASLLYMRHLNEKKDHLGLKVCLLSHQDEQLSVDFLPITLTYQLGKGRFALIYELLGFGVRF